jgi:DNA gyrase subunit A
MAVSVGSFLGLPKNERVLNVIDLESQATIAVGTKQGVVKRVVAEYPPKDEFEIISLKPGDAVVGAFACDDSSELVFVTSDAQLLHFSAANVRPQGRPAGGMAGINLDGSAFVLAFNVVDPTEAVVITAANSSAAIPGTDAGSLKVSAFSEFPGKGRATGGVRAQRFIRNEDQLYFAWVGANPWALATDGKPMELPTELAKRDASGSPMGTVIGSVGQAAV